MIGVQGYSRAFKGIPGYRKPRGVFKDLQGSSKDICPLKYYELLSALKFWNTCKNNCINNCNYERFVEKLTKCQSANKLAYTKLISTKCTHPTHNQQKWIKDCHQNDVDSFDWRDAYQLASLSTPRYNTVTYGKHSLRYVRANDEGLTLETSAL